MSKSSTAKSVVSRLHSRFDEICLEIEKFAINENEQLLRNLVDERRFIHASLIEYQSKPEVTSKIYKKSKQFLDAWAQRLFAVDCEASFNEYLSDPDFCNVYLDCMIPLIWNWDRDWLVLVKPAHEMLIAAALDRNQRHILIYEPNPNEKQYDLFESDTVFVAKTLDEVRKCLNNHKYPIIRMKGVFCGTDKLQEEEKKEIDDLLKKSVTKHRLNMNTAKILTCQWVENFINNSHRLASFPHISKVEIRKTNTAVLVAPGPSLNKNIHLLKKLRGRALIVCVLHALPRLVKEDIKPDVVIHIDAKPDRELVEYLVSTMDFEIPLLIVSANLPRHYQDLPHKNIAWTEVSGGIHFELCKFLNIQFPHLSGGNVSLYAFNLCAAWGIKNIALVGQDLSYQKGQYYADSEGLKNAISVKETAVNTEALEIEGYFGGMVKTSNDFSLFIDQFSYWAQMPLHENSRLINCTEGGAKIPPFEQMPLSELIRDVVKSEENIQVSVNFNEVQHIKFKRLFKEYFSHYLYETKVFLEHANICAKVARAKIPSKRQANKRALAEEELKRISGENKLLEAYLVRLITDTNLDNGGMINTISSEQFYAELCQEVIRFRTHLVNAETEFT